MLFVDEFDPHEPFDTPEPCASMYDPDWEGAHLIWPPYADGGVAPGTCDALTTSVDLFATLADLFGVEVRQRTHGHSLLPLPDERAFLDRMPGSKVPVIHQQWQKGDMLPYWALTRFSGHHLYDIEDDPEESRNLAGSNLEMDLAERLRQALSELGAPESQFQRLGL